MGYTTDFRGQFTLNKKLDDATYELLVGLNQTRRMKRKGLGKEYGVEGEFYIENKVDELAPNEMHKQCEGTGVVDSNTPPRTQPGLWCQWTPTDDRLHIEWDGGEKFYEYVAWIEYLITSVLKPRGYVLNGEVEWLGEDPDDRGLIVVKKNVVTTKEGKVVYK